MNCASLFLALQLLLTVVASAWNPYSLTKCLLQRVSFTSPKIPQIVLDTRHPWVKSNHALLSRYPNVAEAICSRNSSLWTSPASPDQALPADLFEHIKIHSGGLEHDWCHEREGWLNVRHRLKELVSCEAAMEGVRHLDVDLDVYYEEPELPPAGIPELFADVLPQMRNLERLDWDMNVEVTREFEPTFVAKGLMLPSVKYLQPGAGSDYMVSRCPNIEVLEAGNFIYHGPYHASWQSGSGHLHRAELIKASTGLENLRELRLSTGGSGWTLDMLKDILYATPNIKILHMDGFYLRPTPKSTWESGRFQRQTLEEYLRVLSLFPNLEDLQLLPSWALDMGFDGGHWCGNAYGGPEGRAYGRQVTQESAEATEFAANITMRALPRLKSLKIGSGSSANLTLNDRGQPDMTWPWTGRMKQYTYDVWPEPFDFWEE